MPSCGHRSLGVKRALPPWELDREPAGMEHEGVGPGAGGHRTVVPFVAVTRIADNRVPKVAEVKPDLVESSGFRAAFNEAVARRFVRAHGHLDLGPRQGGVPGDRLLGLGVVRRGERFLDHALVFCPPSNHGPIDLGGPSVHELKLQVVQRVAWGGKEDNAACGLVKAMHGLQPRLAGARRIHEVSQIVRFVEIDVRAVHQQSVGLDHRQDALFLEQRIKSGFCTGGG